MILKEDERKLYLNIAIILEKQNESQSALNHLDKAYTLSDNNKDKIEILYKKTSIYENVGKNFDASATIKKIINILINEVPIQIQKMSYANNRMGEILIKIEEYELAISSFIEAIEFISSIKFDSKLYFSLGNTYQKFKPK